MTFNQPLLAGRRFAIRSVSADREAVAFADGSQNAILRYGRLQICATLSLALSHHGRVRGVRPIKLLFASPAVVVIL